MTDVEVRKSWEVNVGTIDLSYLNAGVSGGSEGRLSWKQEINITRTSKEEVENKAELNKIN